MKSIFLAPTPDGVVEFPIVNVRPMYIMNEPVTINGDETPIAMIQTVKKYQEPLYEITLDGITYPIRLDNKKGKLTIGEYEYNITSLSNMMDKIEFSFPDSYYCFRNVYRVDRPIIGLNSTIFYQDISVIMKNMVNRNNEFDLADNEFRRNSGHYQAYNCLFFGKDGKIKYEYDYGSTLVSYHGSYIQDGENIEIEFDKMKIEDSKDSVWEPLKERIKTSAYIISVKNGEFDFRCHWKTVYQTEVTFLFRSNLHFMDTDKQVRYYTNRVPDEYDDIS